MQAEAPEPTAGFLVLLNGLREALEGLARLDAAQAPSLEESEAQAGIPARAVQSGLRQTVAAQWQDAKRADAPQQAGPGQFVPDEAHPPASVRLVEPGPRDHLAVWWRDEGRRAPPLLEVGNQSVDLRPAGADDVFPPAQATDV